MGCQPVPRRLLGLSVVCTVVFSFLFRHWSALMLFCRKCTGLEKLDTAMFSADTMPCILRTSSPLADSSYGAPMRQNLVSMDETFTQASSAGSPQSDSSQSQRDTRAAAISSTTRLWAFQIFSRAVSAGETKEHKFRQKAASPNHFFFSLIKQTTGSCCELSL